MPQEKCFVPGCKSEALDHTRYFAFPVNPEIRQKWIQFCGVSSRQPDKDYICSHHFTEEDYLASSRLLGRSWNRWRLTRTAVPSLNPPENPEFFTIALEEEAVIEEETLMDQMEDDIITEEEEEVDIPTTSLCRLCLTPLEDCGIEGAANLFQSNDDAESIASQLLGMFQIEMEDGRGWPASACAYCVQNLAHIREFRDQILRSHCNLYEKIVKEDGVQAEISEAFPPPINSIQRATNYPPPPIVHKRRYGKERLIRMSGLAKDLRLLNCHVCGKRNRSLGWLIYHVKAYHQTTATINCCDEQWPLNYKGLDHLKNHVEKDAKKCLLCKQEFPTAVAKIVHFDEAHPKVEPLTEFKCVTCDKVFKENRLLDVHKLIHLPVEQRPFECPHCKIRFTSQAGVKRHINRVHDVKIRTICEHCGKGFSDNGNLNPHKKNCAARQGPNANPNAKKLKSVFDQ